jgi:PP-loop superfamily ATP-utilizing enzyme
LDPELRINIFNFFKSRGFRYVTLDLEGYRPGSMNVAAGENIVNAKREEIRDKG